MFAVQQPLHWSALEEVMGVPAWKSLPSWFLVADGDQAIPPDAQRKFAGRMGATHRRGPDRPCGDGLPPRRGGEPHHDRRPSRAGRNLNEMSPAQLQPQTSPSINPLPMKRTHGRSIMTKVVVICGTGLIGSKVVARLPSSR